MGVIFTTYCQVQEVDAYAERFGLTDWSCRSDDEKKGFVERANRQIHAWHAQEMLWKPAEFNLPCILQTIYIAKNNDAMDLAEIANNASAGSFNDSINNVESGADVKFEDWAFTLMKRVLSLNQINNMPRWAHG